MADKTEFRALQELTESQGWDIFCSLVRGKLKEQVIKNLQTEVRKGDSIRAAQYVGQIDHLEVILDIPNKEMSSLRART